MTGIKIPVSADFDGADVEKAIAKLNEQMNRLAQTVAAANKVKFTPVDKGSLDQLKQIEQRFQELTKISGALRDRIKATGQGSAGFGELDWGRLYDDPVIRQRKMMQAFQHVTSGTAYGFSIPTPVASGGRQPSAPPAPPPPPAPSGPGLASTIGGIATAGLRATGPVGGVVANAGSAAAAGGFSAGLMGLFGGLAALAIGKGVSAIKGKIDAAGQEAIGYDTLKRTLGDVNVSFLALREGLRAASKEIDTTFEQTQKMGAEFVRVAGQSKDLDPRKLAEEVAVGGGFGRSFGINPEQSNAFFAQMRQFRVTENTNDSRKLALMIGEAVGKSGQFGKMDEVLQAISTFAATQTRTSLAGANVEGYTGLLSGFMASRTPGLDAQGAAALLGRVNGAIMGGGAVGEAGQNYLFSALGKKYGLNPVQVALLEQQGAFGTGRMAFGSGSLFQQFTAKFGGGVPGMAANSTDTNLSTILAKVQRDYHSNPSLMLNATARLLGINENQAMALHTIGPQSVNGMVGRMGRLGLDMGALSPTGISALANIETGDHDTLLAQADALKKRTKNPLSVSEAKQLDAALADKDDKTGEKLKDVLTQLTYSREQEMTQGKETIQAIQGVDKRLQELATGLVSPMNDMRNAMVWLAGGGKMGSRGINAAVDAAERKEITEGGAAKEANINERYGALITTAKGRAEQLAVQIRARYAPGAMAGMKPDQQAAYLAETKRMEAEMAAARDNAPDVVKRLESERDAELAKVRAETSANLKLLDASKATPAPVAGETTLTDRDKVMRELARTDREVGLSPGTSAAQINKESGFNPSAYNKRTGAMGMAQVMPKTLAAIEKRLGRKLDPYNADDAVIIHREIMRENKKRFGTDAGALAAYDSGWNPARWGNPETVDYLSTIERNRGLFATPMPEGASSHAPAQGQTVNFNGEFTLVTPSGQRVGDPLRMNKRVALPAPSGG